MIFLYVYTRTTIIKFLSVAKVKQSPLLILLTLTRDTMTFFSIAKVKLARF